MINGDDQSQRQIVNGMETWECHKVLNIDHCHTANCFALAAWLVSKGSLPGHWLVFQFEYVNAPCPVLFVQPFCVN